jgi:hypothetical protein
MAAAVEGLILEKADKSVTLLDGTRVEQSTASLICGAS